MGSRRTPPEGSWKRELKATGATAGHPAVWPISPSSCRVWPGGLFDPYRPELYYMRGPGPKWHAKHDRTAAGYQAMPALVRVRAKR